MTRVDSRAKATPSQAEPGAPVVDVSVIVPVYNKAPYLAGCLESVLGQSLSSLEVICVDDGSTDGSSEILKRYAVNDARVRIIRHDRNRGAAAARNRGLSAARGEFVQFTDADDLLATDALRLLLSRARADSVDVVRGGLVKFTPDAPDRSTAPDIPVALRRVRPLDHRTFWVPWWHTTYLYSRRFLESRRIAYPDLCSGEDPVFLAKVLVNVPRISTISDVVYRHRLAALEDKGRATYRHVQDYLSHVGTVRDLWLEAHPKAWYDGFAPFVRPEVEFMVQTMPMTPGERRLAVTQVQRIFEPASLDGAPRSRVKVLFLSEVCSLGGVETAIANKMEALRPYGVETRALFHSIWGESGKLALRQPGFVVRENDEAHRRFIADWNPDAIVVVDAPWLIDAAAAAGVRCPVLFESHLSDRDALDWRVQGGVTDVRVSAVVVPSEFNRALLAGLGALPDRVRVIPNPIDPERFRPRIESGILETLGLPADRRLVLFVGRLEPAKNPLEFVRLCGDLLEADAGLHGVVVGEAVDAQEYAATVRAEASPNAGTLSFVDRVPYDDMPMLYSAAAASGGCLVSTSLHESQPMVVLEAMACGCPVVASDVGGLRQIVEEGVTGYLYPAGDRRAATRAVTRVLADRSARERVVRTALERVRAGHGLAAAANGYLEVLDEVGAGHDPAHRSSFEVLPEHAGGMVTTTPVVSLSQRLTTLFSEPVLVGAREPVVPYTDLAPGIQMGFEPSAAVVVERRPKQDFSLSPDHCLNTFFIDYRGPSRWLSLETKLDWAELRGIEHYQFGLHGRPNRLLRCRVALRLPSGADASLDFRLCDLALPAGGRSAHGRGRFQRKELLAEQERPPKVMFFFSAENDLELALDFLTGYFA